MIHVKIDVVVHWHHKFRAVGFDGTGLWTKMMALTRDSLLDGRVPKDAMDGLGGTTVERAKILAKLITAGLVTDDGDHFTLARYAEKGNDTRDDVERRRREDRDRKRNGRRSDGVSDRNPIGVRPDSKGSPPGFPASASASASAPDLSGSERATGMPTEAASGVMRSAPIRDPHGNSYVAAAWCDGCAAGSGGSPPPAPSGGALRDLLAAEATLGPALTDQKARCDRLRAVAAEYGRSRKAGEAMNVWKFGDWLTTRSGTAPPASTVPAHQRIPPVVRPPRTSGGTP